MVEDGQDGGAVRPFTRIDAISGLHGQHRGEVEEDVVAAAGCLVRGAGSRHMVGATHELLVI